MNIRPVFLSAALVAMTSLTPLHAKSAKSSDDVLGTYKVISSKYGIDRAIVEAHKDNRGKYYFKVTKVIKSAGIENITTCQKCPGKFKDRPVKGMVSIWNLQPSKKNPYILEGGYGIDPWSGRMFQGVIKLSKNKQTVQIKATPLGTKIVSRGFSFIRVDGTQ